MPPTYNEPEKLDTLSEKTLSALYKRGRASTGKLRKMTGGKSRSIRHRMDVYLIPAEVVREVDRREHAGNDERVFELTADGQRLVEDQWSDLTHYAQRDEVLDATRETRDRLDLLHDRLDQFDRRLERAEGEVDRRLDAAEDQRNNLKSDVKGDVGQLRSSVEEAEDRLDTVEDDIEDLDDRLDELEGDVDEYDERLDTIEQIAEEAWARARQFELEWDVEQYLTAGSVKTLVYNRTPFGSQGSDERDWER